MTNAVGYYYNEREERVNKTCDEYKHNAERGLFNTHDSYDINRDFPYN
jgi:hypothetical protein